MIPQIGPAGKPPSESANGKKGCSAQENLDVVKYDKADSVRAKAKQLPKQDSFQYFNALPSAPSQCIIRYEQGRELPADCL